MKNRAVVEMGSGTSAGYMNQLDAVRGIAVGMVIFSHWSDKSTFWFNGYVGVQLFFVISGFLITGILLDARGKAQQLGTAPAAVIKSFYIRRFLRIFPLFYATLAIAFVCGVPAVRTFIWWLIPYMSNVLFATRGRWFDGVAHFWSLAVEEQFYLVWPVLIFYASRRLLLPLIGAAIVIAPIFRALCCVLGINAVATYVLPFASLDTLGLGAMLALLQRNSLRDGSDRALMALGAVSALGCSVFFTLNIVGSLKPLPPFLVWVKDAAVAPTALGVVWLAARGIRGPVGWFMDLPPLGYAGRISYGLYILHPFIPSGVSKVLRILGLPLAKVPHSYLTFAFDLAVLLGVCSLSWHFLEKRLNGLKRYFPYVSPATANLGSLSRVAVNAGAESHLGVSMGVRLGPNSHMEKSTHRGDRTARPKVSLYIPCYNAARYIARTIEGALRQSCPLDEILVIDDGSKDRTREIASRYPVRVLRHERNLGLAAARNTGFHSARNELVASLDADCVAEPDWLQKLLPHLDDPKVGGAGGALEESVLSSLADRWRKVHMPENWGDALRTDPPFLFGANGLHRKSALEEVGGYDDKTWIEGCGEDTDISKKLIKRGYNLIYDPSGLVKHIKQDTVRSVLNTRWRWWRYGVQAYFQRIRLRSVLATFYRAHFRTMFFEHVAQDFHSRNYELLWLDFLCLLYMPYRDVRLYCQRKFFRSRHVPSAA